MHAPLILVNPCNPDPLCLISSNLIIPNPNLPTRLIIPQVVVSLEEVLQAGAAPGDLRHERDHGRDPGRRMHLHGQRPKVDAGKNQSQSRGHNTNLTQLYHNHSDLPT